VIAISASGYSKNVINGILETRKHKVTTIGFTGFDGGILGPMVDINIHVPSNVIEHVEDIHLMLEHIIICAIKERDSQEIVALSPAESLPVETFGD
jgi:D-sedoheptulose 7-phosphate isomerase